MPLRGRLSLLGEISDYPVNQDLVIVFHCNDQAKWISRRHLSLRALGACRMAQGGVPEQDSLLRWTK